jgi:hypothetical protein
MELERMRFEGGIRIATGNVNFSMGNDDRAIEFEEAQEKAEKLRYRGH